jgi:hypothetical protein
MTTLKKSLKKKLSLKKSLSLKKNLKKNLSLKKSLKKVSGKENKSMRGGAWRPPRFQPPPPTHASKYQLYSMRTIYQNFKPYNGQQRIPSAEQYEPKYTQLPQPSKETRDAFIAREAMTTMQRRAKPLTQQQKKTFGMVRRVLLEEEYSRKNPQ